MNFRHLNSFWHFSPSIFQVFSKLKEGRFPAEVELKEIVGRKLASSRISDGVGGLWP